MKGKTINGFELIKQLGKGGMAEVWYAENDIHKRAAVKILNPDLSLNAEIVQRFRREAEIMVQLEHPNIRGAYSFGNIDERPAIVMEYMEGDDLKTLMDQGRHFTETELEQWWNQLVDALNYAHSHELKVIHRDIKPSNIFLTKRNGCVKLMDFGIAKVRESIGATQTGQKLGTLMYMSPEQVRDPKRVGPNSDAYSLAVTFIHLLTGKKPYDSDSSSDYDIQENIVRKPLDLSAVPSGWRGFLKPYLAKEADKRPLLEHFEPKSDVDDETEIDEGSSSSKRTESGSGGFAIRPEGKGDLQSPHPSELKDKSPKNKKPLWIALGIAAVVALLVFLLWPKKDDPDDPIPTEPTLAELDSIAFYGCQTVADYRNYVAEYGQDARYYAEAQDFIDRYVADSTARADGILTITANGVSFVMKRVEGGSFQMGSNDSDAYSDEKPVHSVTLSSYYMGETEVTQALWKAVMGEEPTYDGGWIDAYGRGSNYPAYRVSWNDIQDFIRKLNSITGRNFRLPTEAEWEFAARGGNQSNGYKYAGSSNIGGVAWYDDNSGSKTHTVKGKSPNELGLYDMSGNVWEWCSDWYGSYSSGSQTNPKGASSGSYCVLRGGSWFRDTGDCRVSRRRRFDPCGGSGDFGVRLCLPQFDNKDQEGNYEQEIEPIVEDEKEYVDLGLPSGTLWATCNIGASKPEDYGNYYAWGETTTKNTYTWANYKYANGDYNKLTKYCNDSKYGNNGFTDNLTVLQNGDDPATSNWGSGWQTPSKAQWDELLANTTNQWTTRNGVKGRLFTSKKNGLTIFFPAAGSLWDGELYDVGNNGSYWSRSHYGGLHPYCARYFFFYSSGSRMDYQHRYGGFSVRSVR